MNEEDVKWNRREEMSHKYAKYESPEDRPEAEEE